VAEPQWLTVKQAAQVAQVGPKTIYRAIRSKRLRAAVISGRRDYRVHVDWISAWLESSAAPIEIMQRRIS